MKKHEIVLSTSSYNIYIENGLLEHLEEYVKDIYINKKVYIITDSNVAPIYLDKAIKALPSYEVDYVIVEAGEASKSLKTYANVCEQLLDKQIRRNNLLIALGGGVVGDLTGFVAATLYRGIPFINIPTSLLSQMDSSIGGKTGIDFYGRKNILGAFNQPKLVIIDPNTLDTLDKREFNNGMGELIKHAIISNKKLFQTLEGYPKINEDIIYESLAVKREVVMEDEFDQGRRMILNFGHTFGHAIELHTNYKHGECVAIGMVLAIKMGIDLGITNKNVLNRIINILNAYELPMLDIDYHSLLNEVKYDKKNLAGIINFILIKDIGECIIHQISENEMNN